MTEAIAYHCRTLIDCNLKMIRNERSGRFFYYRTRGGKCNLPPFRYLRTKVDPTLHGVCWQARVRVHLKSLLADML